MKTQPIRIGLITDLSGPYQGVDGPHGAEAIRMAIEDAGVAAELVTGDHRNDADEARRLAEQWLGTDGIDMIISGVNSDTSLAMAAVADARHKLMLVVGAGTSVQTRERPSPYVIQYAYDTVALGTVPGKVLTEQGKDRWFFITADYPFGHELEAHATAAIRAAGGTVVGGAINPHGADDFVSYLEQARDSGATVLGVANGHAGLVKAMDAATRIGVADRMTIVGLLTFIDDLHAMGLEEARGLYFADSWFWTRDDESRAWAKRFHARCGRMPSSLQAADYSAALQHLKAVQAVGTTETASVLRHLRSASLDDMYVKGGRIRADGAMLHPIALLKAKSPSASNLPWDYYDQVATVSGEQAFVLPSGGRSNDRGR